MLEISLIEELVIGLINFFGLILIFWVYKDNKKEKLNQWFSVMTFFVIMWVDFAFLGKTTENNFIATIFKKLNFGAVSLFLVASFNFYVTSFLKEKHPILKKIILVCGLFFLYLSLFSDFIIQGVSKEIWGNEIIFGWGNNLFNFFALFVASMVVGFLIKKYFHLSQKEKLKTQYFLIGTLLFIGFNIIFNIILPFFLKTTKYYLLGDYSILFLLLFTAYAIVKQELFGIKTVLTTLFVSLTALLLIIDTFIFTETAYLRFFKIIILAGFLLLGYLLIKSVNKEIKRREELEKLTSLLGAKTKDMATMLEVSKLIATKETQTKRVIQEALNTIPEKLEYLGFSTGFLILHNTETNELCGYITSQNHLTKKALPYLETIKKSFESFCLPITTNTMAAKVFKTQKMIISNQFADFIVPPVDKITANKLQKITESKSVLIAPVIAHGQTIGVLGILMKPRVGEIDDRRKKLAIAFTNHLAIILENSRYLENIQAKSQDLTALFNLSQISASLLHTEKTAQKMIDAIPTLFGHLGYSGGALCLYNEKNGDISPYVITQNKLSQKVQKLLDKKIHQYKINITKHTNLITKTITDQTAQTSGKFEDVFGDALSKYLCRTIQKLVKATAITTTPIITRGKTKGVVIYIIHKPIDEISQRDKDITSNFANQLGLALENSSLYGETKKSAEKLQKTNEELKKALEAKSNFLSIASHQLRTPVSIAKGMLSMLVDDSVPKEKRTSFLQRSLVNVERLSDIIHDLLSASAISGKNFQLNKQPTQIDELVDKIITERTIKATENNLKLIYKKPKKASPTLNIDPNKIGEVFANLIDNSINYTLKGQIKINTSVKNNYFIFKIKDTGIGIKRQDISKIFKKISRLPEAIKIRPDGTGLGLFLVQNIVKAHHGKIEVESEGTGKGSTFIIRLPIK